MSRYKQNEPFSIVPRRSKKAPRVFLGRMDLDTAGFSHRQLSDATKLAALDQMFGDTVDYIKKHDLSVDDPVFGWPEYEISQTDPAIIVRYVMWLIEALTE